jgi:predicted  nucleic acid-binding Zn-ribbon protein
MRLIDGTVIVVVLVFIYRSIVSFFHDREIAKIRQRIDDPKRREQRLKEAEELKRLNQEILDAKIDYADAKRKLDDPDKGTR